MFSFEQMLPVAVETVVAVAIIQMKLKRILDLSAFSTRYEWLAIFIII